jgi:hypothetical protein
MTTEIKYGTLNVVGEKTLAAITIETPTVAGWIFGVDVYDETTGEDFIYSEKSGRNPFPLTIPYDHAISVSALAEHTGDALQWMQLTIELIDPDGIARRTASAHFNNVSPGTTINTGRKTDPIVPDKPGTWKIHVLLEAELA